MEMRYFVDYKLHNAKNDGWAFKTTKNTIDLAEAKKDYHSQLSQYIGSTSYDFVQVTLSDMYGNKIMSEYWQKPVEPTPEPEPTSEPTTDITNEVVA